MKGGDKRRVSTLRMMNAAIKDRDIEARGVGRGALSDEELATVFQKMVKQRQESLDIYDKAGRTELATQEREEIEIISAYLPKQLSEAEVRAAIEGIVKEIGAQGLKDMRRVMDVLKERYAGKMDFGKAGPV